MLYNVYDVPVVLLLLLPLFLSLSLSLCLCSRIPHTTMSPFLYLSFYFFAATTKCLYKRHLFPTTSAQTDFVCVLCTSSSTAAVASLSLPLSLCLIPHTTMSPFLYLPFYFSQLQRSVCTNGIYSLLPFWHVYFTICDHGPDSLHAVIRDKTTFSPLTGGCSEGLGAFRFFLELTTNINNKEPHLYTNINLILL